MNEYKPLEALEKLRQNIKDNSHLFDDELLDIIEKALKEYAGFQIVFKLSNRKEGKKIHDKLKAFEIIKKKVPLIYLLAGFVGKYDPEEVEIIKEVYLND